MRLLRILPWLALPAVMLAASCRDPTEITITVTTDLGCPSTPGAPATQGVLAMAWVASAGTQVEASTCTPRGSYNYIGTIVIVPGRSGDDAKVDVTVVGSVNPAKNDECRRSKQNEGECLVVRRSLSFIPHTPLTLPIRLDSRCLDVQCADSETCIDGLCKPIDVGTVPPVDAGVDAPPSVRLEATDLFAGQNGTCAILKDKRVVCWGDNADDQLLAQEKPRAQPEVIASLSGATEIALGERHGCALFAASVAGTAKVSCWGDNSFAQLATLDIQRSNAPVDVFLPPGLGAPNQLRTGKDFTCVLRKINPANGTESPIYCWGDDRQGQSSGSGKPGTAVHTPTMVPNAVGARLALGDDFACAGQAPTAPCFGPCPTAVCWGSNAHQQCIGPADVASPTPVSILGDLKGPLQIDTGANHVAVTLETLTSYGWGNNADGQLPGAPTPAVTPPALIGKFADGPRALGAHHSCTLSQGMVACWGKGAVVDATPSLTGVKKLVGGSNHVCIIDASDHVRCWGQNDLGQLGSATPGDTGPRIIGMRAP